MVKRVKFSKNTLIIGAVVMVVAVFLMYRAKEEFQNSSSSCYNAPSTGLSNPCNSSTFLFYSYNGPRCCPKPPGTYVKTFSESCNTNDVILYKSSPSNINICAPKPTGCEANSNAQQVCPANKPIKKYNVFCCSS